MNSKLFYTNKKNIILIALICTLLWGSAYPSVKIGYTLFNISTNDIASKIIFAGYRFILSGTLVLLITLIMHKKISVFHLAPKTIRKVTLLGLTQTTLQYICFYIGLSYSTGVRSSILNSTSTFFSIIIAHFLYKDDKLSLNKILGCTIGFIGVIVVNMNGSSLLNNNFTFRGDGLLILSCLFASSAAIYGKLIMQNNDAFVVTGYQLFIGGVALTLLGFALGGKVIDFSAKALLLLLYLGTLSAIAFSLWSELLKHNKVGQVTIFNFLIPVFGTILSALFLKENIFDIRIVIALLLVSAGIYLVNKISK